MRQKFCQLTQSTNVRLLKNAHPQLVFFLQHFEHTWFTTFPRMCTMSMRVLLLYVQSTHARDITTDSMSEWEKEWNRKEWVFLKNSAKRRKTTKIQLFAVQTQIPQSSPRKKMARLEGSNFQFRKSIGIEKFEYWRLLDKYQSCVPERKAWKQIWVLCKINYNYFFSLNISFMFSQTLFNFMFTETIWIYVCWDSFQFYVYWSYIIWESTFRLEVDFALQLSMFKVPSTSFLFAFHIQSRFSSSTDYTETLAAPQCLHYHRKLTVLNFDSTVTFPVIFTFVSCASKERTWIQMKTSKISQTFGTCSPQCFHTTN